MPTPPPAAAPTTPDPAQDRAAATPANPSRALRLLCLVRNLIGYGKELVQDLQQNAAGMNPFRLASRFDTDDVALIFARIARGLRLAAGLEARLISHPPKEKSPTATGGGAAHPAAATRPPRASPEHRRARLAEDPRLAALPSAAEIAAECRRRPIGAVLADICRDLCIYPAHPLWRELNDTIWETGGNAGDLLSEALSRGVDYFHNSPLAQVCLIPPMPPGWKPPRPPAPMGWDTGPPAAMDWPTGPP